MTRWIASRITFRTWSGVCATIWLAVATAAHAQTAAPPHLQSRFGSLPGNIFSPASTPAQITYSVSLFVFGIVGVIFVVVAGVLLYVIVRYRQRPGEELAEPPQVYGSHQIELSWTVIPVLIVVVLFLVTARVIFGIQNAPRPADAMDVTVVGHQFWWEFRYPKLGIVTANELHIPVSNPKAPLPTYLTLLSADVDHSFWVPRLAGKTDLIPNHVNQMWVDPTTPGVYLGQCGQYCGTEHAKMLLRVYVDTPQDFAAWVRQQQQPVASLPHNNAEVEAGQQVFATNACVNCHTVAGTSAHGRFGPDLTHLMSRQTIAAGAAENTAANLRAWIQDPDTFKRGSRMPAMKLTDLQLDQITAYLSTLH
ncbi:MAG TPA: cytochrome c oxidase subunit II [Acidobacteriaceae bacterium]|nr:cytochrome c oxidase subunit II [Acidobacteriaceae bacterium]